MFHFVPNLKSYTVHRGRGNRRFDAYLLSADYVRGSRHLASEVVRGGQHLCADNGNVDLIRALLKEFEPRARALALARKQEQADNDLDYPRPGQLSVPLRNRYRLLARELVRASKAAIDRSYIERTIELQLSMNPTYLIGMEDFAVATLTGLSVEPEYSMLRRRFYRARSNRAIRLARETLDGKYGLVDVPVFAGLHAIDYDTAQLAGALAGEAGLDSIATGLVGALRDRDYVDFRVQDRRVIELASKVPRPYVRVMEIASGLHVGFVNATGRRPRFHALGAGTPILIPLLSLLGDRRTYTASDSTSPIVDGWSSPTISLYVDTPAPLKYKAHRIAEYWLGEGKAWACRCPYCRRFNGKYPPRLGPARAWWRSEGKPGLTRGHMHRSSPLAVWLPLLSHHPDDGIRREGGMARVGHNHWVLQRLESAARRHSQRRSDLRRWVAGVIDAYQRSVAAAPWKAATAVAWQIADAAHVATAGARSAPTLRRRNG